MKWVDALKVYNTGKTWCVPRKGSPEHAEVMKIMGKSKVESPAAPVAAAKMSVSKAEAVKQIKAHKEKEEKVSSMAAKVKERKAMRLLKALVVARRVKKAAKASVTPSAIFTSLWEGEPSENNSIRFKSAASNADIIKTIRENNASTQSLAFTVSTSSNGSKLITPQGSSYQVERAFQTTFNRKAWVAYNDADGDKYSAAEIDKFKPGSSAPAAAAASAKKSKKTANKEPTDPSIVGNHIESELREIIEEQLTGVPDDKKEEYISENYDDLVEDLGGGYGVFDDVIDELVRRLKYSKKTMVKGMKDLRDQSGYTMFDDYIEKYSKK